MQFISFYVFFVIYLYVCLSIFVYMNKCVWLCVYWHEWHDNHKWSIRITISIMLECTATTAIVVLAIRDMNDDGNKVEKMVFYWATKTRWMKIWNMMTSSLASSLLSSVKLISFLSCHKLNLTSMNFGWQQQ